MSIVTTDSDSWIGSALVDLDKCRLGTIEDIYFDAQSGRPQWLLVRNGRFGMRRILVPLAEARRIREGIMTPYDKRRIDRAPRIDPAEDLHDEQTAELYRHYGLRQDELVETDEPDPPSPRERVLSYLT